MSQNNKSNIERIIDAYEQKIYACNFYLYLSSRIEKGGDNIKDSRSLSLAVLRLIENNVDTKYYGINQELEWGLKKGYITKKQIFRAYQKSLDTLEPCMDIMARPYSNIIGLFFIMPYLNAEKRIFGKTFYA